MSEHLRALRRAYFRDISESLLLGLVLTAISYLVGIYFDWISFEKISWLEVFAVFTSYSCTYLCVKERRINYPIGILSTAAYAYLFWKNGLMASAVLNAYLTPSLIYGWFRWRKDTEARPVSRVSIKWVPIYLLITIVAYLGSTIINKKLGGVTAWTDSLILVGSILAQFLLDNKKIESWFIWAIVNIFAIYTYSKTGLALVAFQYVFFLINTIIGFKHWKRSMKNEERIRTDDSYATDSRAPAIDTIFE